MELHKNNGIWVKGDCELNPSEPAVTESTVYSFIPNPAEGSPAGSPTSLEIRAEVYAAPCAEVMMHLRTSHCPPPLLASVPGFLSCLIYVCG